MENKKINHKIILECSKQGEVEQIFLDTARLLENIELPVGLHSIVSPISIKGLGDFWISTQDKFIGENTMLSLSYNDKNLNYIFSGYLLKDTVLLCGKTELTYSERALEEIMLINNEQANQIRLTEKKVGNIQKAVEKQELNEAFLNDFSSLNNELVNSKRELMRKNQKIELLNKELNAVNENMSMFTYSVSHDLKAPVRSIKSLISIIHKKSGESLDQKGQSYVDMALESANKLSKMLDNLLEYHRSSNFSTSETVDLNEVLQEVKYILQNEIALKSFQINSENLPIIKGSSAGCLQIFQNLISNAIKFIPEERAPVVEIKVEENETHYKFMIKDNGIGIAENKSEEIFNLFKRLNSIKEYEGNGMGLAMVKRSVERMGGEIWLESEEGRGSTFYFTLKKS